MITDRGRREGALVGGALLSAVAIGALLAGTLSDWPFYLGLAAAGLGFLFWLPAVYLVFLAVMVEGFFRLYFDTPLVLLLKDALLAGVYLRVFGGRLLKNQPLLPAAPINLPLAIFAAIVLLQALNPNILAPEQALVGIRTWLYYVPLYFVALEMHREPAGYLRFVWILVLTAVPMCAVAIFQFSLGPDSYAALGAGFARALFVTGDASFLVYRPNSLFAWSSHFSAYLSVVALLALGLLVASRRAAFALALGVFVLVSSTVVIEAQRTQYLLLPLAMAMVVALASQQRRKILTGIAITVVLLGVAGSSFDISTPVQRLTNTYSNRDDVVQERLDGYMSMVQQAFELAPFGLGTGATAIGTRYVADALPLFTEVSIAKVIGDLGIVGLVAYIWLWGSLLAATLVGQQRLGKVKGAHGPAAMVAAVLMIQALSFWSGYDIAIVAIPLWFLSGLAQALYAREGTVQEQTLARAAAVRRPATGISVLAHEKA